MDEGAEALDTLTDRAVMEAVKKFRGHRTIIIVAHRLTIARNLDRILFLRNGEIKSAGLLRRSDGGPHGVPQTRGRALAAYAESRVPAP